MPREKSKESAMRDALEKWAVSQSDDPYMLDQIGKPKTRKRRADAPNPKFRVKEAMIPGAGQGPQSFGVPKNFGTSPEKKLQQSQKIGVPKVKPMEVKPLQVKMAAFGPKLVGVRGGKNIPLEEFLAKAKGFGGRAKELLRGGRVGRLDAAKAKLQEALHHPKGAKAVMEKGDLVQGILNPRVGISQMRRMAKPVEAAMKETSERRSQISEIAKDLAREKLKSRASQVGASVAGGAALASPVLALQALNTRAAKEREKKAYATNQYSGNMGPGPMRNYAAGMPSYGVRGFSPNDPNTKTAGPPSQGKKEKKSCGYSKRASAMADELAKLNGVATTPKGKLYQGQNVGGPKVTAPHGPSIAEQSKPIGYGLKQPGAIKNAI